MADIQVHIGLKSGNESYILNKQRINSIGSLSQSNSDASTIFYGVLSNTGNLEVSDKNGEIKKLVESDKIDVSNVSIEIYANNKMVQGHTSADSGYEDNTLKVSLHNKLSDISNTIYSGDDKEGYLTDINAYALLKKICQNSIPELPIPNADYYVPVSRDESSRPFKEFLENITFKDIDLTILNKYTTEELLSYFCNATQSNIFYDVSGNLKIIPARPILNNGVYTYLKEKAIFVPDKCVFDETGASLFVKNKIKKININMSDADIKYVQMRNKRTVFGNFIGSEQEYLDSICFDKFNVDDMDFEKEQEGLRILSKEVNLDYYIQQKISDMEYTFAYSYDGEINYPKTNSRDYISVINENDISSLILNTGMCMLSSGSPIYCAFYDYDESRFVNKYKIMCGAGVEALEKPITFWIVRRPSATAGPRYKKKTFENIEKQFVYAEGNLKNDETLTFSKNPLLTTTSTINVWGNEYLLYDYIVKNIFNDYTNGIKTKSLTVSCSKYLDRYKNYVQKDFSKGDIIEVGDVIVRNAESANDQINWKVTGVNFLYDGEPTLKLELQEAIPVYELDNFMYGLSKNGAMIKTWVQLENENLIEIDGDTLVRVDSSLDGMLNISSKIKIIGNSCFAGCSKLTDIILPENVTYLNARAFENCSALKSLYIPNTVLSIGDYSTYKTFYGCSNLTIYVPFPNEYTPPTEILNMSNCSVTNTNNAIRMKATGTNPNVKLDLLYITNGKYKFWASSNDLFEIKIFDNINNTYIASSGVDGSPDSKAIVEFTLNASDSENRVWVQIDGKENGENKYQTFSDITVINTDKVDENKTTLNYGKFWNCYYFDYGESQLDEVYRFCPVKYGYTREMYKKEVGL